MKLKNKIRRWTFNVTSTNVDGNVVANIPTPGFTMGVEEAAKEAASEIQVQFDKQEAAREPDESKRFTFKVHITGHEGIDEDLFDKFLELNTKNAEYKKSSEMYRAICMVACQELSERHPVELGAPQIVFGMLLKKFHTLSEGKDPKAKVQLVSAQQAASMGLR